MSSYPIISCPNPMVWNFYGRSRAEFGDIPFILFTGKGREEVVIEAMNLGVTFYLQKGSDPVSRFSELEPEDRNGNPAEQGQVIPAGKKPVNLTSSSCWLSIFSVLQIQTAISGD